MWPTLNFPTCEMGMVVGPTCQNYQQFFFLTQCLGDSRYSIKGSSHHLCDNSLVLDPGIRGQRAELKAQEIKYCFNRTDHSPLILSIIKISFPETLFLSSGLFPMPPVQTDFTLGSV